ncbi:MAG: histidine phosphatase family protein [Acidimicrobiales bacterium]
MAFGPEVTLVRHGETEWSRSGQHTGRTEVALTDRGEAEAEALGKVLSAGGPFDLVLVSPRQRARRTAELAGLEGAVVDGDLVEWDYGELEGQTTAQIRQRWPGWRIWDGPWPGGETDEEVGARADKVIARCLEQPAGARVALVAHGHILRVVGARWVGAPAASGGWLGLGTAAVCLLGWEHEARALQLWNYQHPPA